MKIFNILKLIFIGLAAIGIIMILITLIVNKIGSFILVTLLLTIIFTGIYFAIDTLQKKGIIK
jgi:hypothetical protein